MTSAVFLTSHTIAWQCNPGKMIVLRPRPTHVRSCKVRARQLNLTIARLRDVAGPSAPENVLCDQRTPINRDRLAGKRAAALFDDFETASTFVGFCAIVGGTNKCDKGCSMRASTPTRGPFQRTIQARRRLRHRADTRRMVPKNRCAP